ncbi:TIGR02270 family protein [Pseudorhodoferax sp. Leaf267]|uniref:TIGR02270 family protein n=1 Tax=Pseudorhodoferax sp. Leaf267 TaxID=1736316 RepID=UPI00138F09C9|nr:TIGR02270 family protein [Pseudorhodoferax sp. Leaf267]
MQRATGFAPREITALVNQPVVRQHAGDAAFLWRQRDRATGDPRFALPDLAALDARVDAHLQGLHVAGSSGWSACVEQLQRGPGGAVFALGAVAFASADRSCMRAALAAAQSSPALLDELIAALAWLDWDTVAAPLGLLLRARTPVHRLVGLAACALHRRLPGPALSAALGDEDPILRARALRACGELRHHATADRVRDALGDGCEVARFWAAWSLTLLGAPDGLPLLCKFAESPGRFSVPALEMALRNLPPAQAREHVRSLARRDGLARLAVIATGVVGDPVAVPWLIERMDSAALARLAGDAFAAITGADLGYLDLTGPALADTGDPDAADLAGSRYEASLEWPSSTLVARWWQQHRRRFAAGTRHLCGRPLDAGSALGALARGRQPRRRAAVIELARLSPQWVPLELRAPARRQLRALQSWTS